MEDYKQTNKKKLALVLSGGGARGAYEAGVIHYIRTELPYEISRKRAFDILCGTSVGAINTAFMAASNHNLEYQGEHLLKLWTTLEQDQVYKRGVGGLTRLVARSAAGIFSNFFSKDNQPDLTRIPDPKKISFSGFLDTTPLGHYLREKISWKQITMNVQNANPLAVAITATNIHTGQPELFLDKHHSIKYIGRYLTHVGTIDPEQVMASAALPILFPTVRVGGSYYCDGGLRLNTPLSPAIELGAEKILVIGLHQTRAQEHSANFPITAPLSPTLGEVIGKILNSIFLDRLEFDLDQMKRINRILEGGEAAFGPDFMARLNDVLGADHRHPLRKIEVLRFLPSRDVREVFRESVIESSQIRKNLTAFEKILFKVLDVDLVRGQDFLSFILFVPDYLKRLTDLGYADAKARREDLIEFFTM